MLWLGHPAARKAAPHSALVALLLTSSGACSDRPVSYRVVLSGALPASVKPTLTLGSAPLALTRESAERWIASYRAAQKSERLSRRMKELRISLPTPCGPLVLPFRPANPGYDGERGQQVFLTRLESEEALLARHGHVAEMIMHLGEGSVSLPPALTVTVDRRGAPEGTTVALGVLVLPRGSGVAPPKAPQRPWNAPQGFRDGEAELYRIFAPSCPEGRVVRLGGKVVGKLPAKLGRNGALLMDVQGSHCYRERRTRPKTSLMSRDVGKRHLHMRLEGPTAASIEWPFPACPPTTDGSPPCVSLRPTPCPTPGSQPAARPGE